MTSVSAGSPGPTGPAGANGGLLANWELLLHTSKQYGGSAMSVSTSLRCCRDLLQLLPARRLPVRVQACQ